MPADDDLVQIVRSLEALSAWSRRQTPSRVSATTVAALVTLERCGPLRISELAEREALTQPGMTVLVNRLEADDLAERIADPDDGRATLVRLTDTGRSVLTERRHAFVAKVLRLDPPARAALLAAVPAIEELIDPDLRATVSPSENEES